MAAAKPYQVGFIGLGAMGQHMARHINAAFPTGVWNRTRAKSVAHAEEHGTVLVERVEDFRCPVVFCCLPTSQEVKEIAERLVDASSASASSQAAGAAAGGSTSSSSSGGTAPRLLVDCTSGNWRDTVRIGAFLQEHGISMVDCPVALALQYVKFAKNTARVGPLGAAHAVKAVNNIMNTAHLMLATEGLLALAKAGVEPQAALDVINQSSGRSLQTEQRLPQEVLSGRFGYGFKLGLMKKDVDTAAELLAEKFPGASVLPTVARTMGDVAARYGSSTAPAAEGAADDVDYTYVSRYLEEIAGVELRADGVKPFGLASGAAAAAPVSGSGSGSGGTATSRVGNVVSTPSVGASSAVQSSLKMEAHAA